MPAPAPAKPETAETAATLPAPVEEHSPTKPAGSVPENDGSAVRDTVASEPVSEASAIMPAPVETRQPATAGPQVAAPRTVPVTPAPSTDEGTGWLTSRSPGRYTLQLVGSRDRTAVQKFVRKHGIQQPYAIFARDLKGKPWFSLVAGDYPDRDAAVAARAQLPGGLKQSGVWPRTFESIIKSM
jgi:DamX protein